MQDLGGPVGAVVGKEKSIERVVIDLFATDVDVR